MTSNPPFEYTAKGNEITVSKRCLHPTFIAALFILVNIQKKKVNLNVHGWKNG